MTCLGIKVDSKFSGNSSEAEMKDLGADVKMTAKRRIRRHLPVAKGPHTVGVVDIMCERGENGIFFRLYYPTTRTDIYTRDRQWPLWLPHKKYALGYVHFLQWNPAIFGKIFNWLGGDVYVPALWQALLLKSNTPYPVLVFSHGLGGNRTSNTSFCVELASRGFVVAAIEHRDGSASMTLCLKNNNHSTIRACSDYNNETNDGHINKKSEHGHQNQHQNHHHCSHHKLSEGHHCNYFKEEWKWFEHVDKWDDFDYRNGQMYKRAEECRHVLDLLTEMNAGATLHNTLGIAFDTKQFKNQLDLKKVCVAGHSFGGATCLATCSTDSRFQVGVVLDGWMHPVDDKIFSSLKQPILMINMESFQWPVNIKQMMRLLEAGGDADRNMITVRGTCHQSVTDFQFLCNKAMGRFMNVRYKLDPYLCLEMTCKATMGFLTKHLNLESIPNYQEILSGEHDLIISGTNVKWT